MSLKLDFHEHFNSSYVRSSVVSLRKALPNCASCGCVFLFNNKEMTEREQDRIIEMAWEDRTPFEAIKYQFGLSESDVIKFMRRTLKEKSFKLWRKRVSSCVSRKHLMKRSSEITRFKCSRQRSISNNKISKR